MIVIIGLLTYSIIVGSVMMVDFNNEISSYDYEILIAITEAFLDNDKNTTN